MKWDHFSTPIHRSTLRWLGHVARMNCHRLAKIALFGWPKGHEEHRSGRYTLPLWAQWLLSKHGIPLMDRFRLAQKPTRRWVHIVNKAPPRRRLSLQQTLLINNWQPGDEVPQPAPPNWAPPLPYMTRYSARLALFLASTSKGLQVHYDSEHLVQGTVGVGTCPFCLKVFVFRKKKSRHRCPMKPHTLEDVEHMHAYPSAVTLARTLSESPSRWVLFTDGAGAVPGKALFAGWGGSGLGRILLVPFSGR